MSLFDYYQPSEPQKCPICGSALSEWQGGDGPCGLFVWKQGIEFPIDQQAGDESNLDKEELNRFHLPPKFNIYSYDCPTHKPIIATCVSTNGIWVSTIVKS